MVLTTTQMDLSSTAEASPGNSGSVAALPGLSAGRFPSGPGPHSLFARPATRASNNRTRRPPARRRYVSFADPGGMLGTLRRTNTSHFDSLPHESPSSLASFPDSHASEVARAPSAADLMPDISHRSRKRRASDPASESPSMMPPLVGYAPPASTTQTYASPTRRTSTRTRRSPALADYLPVDTGSRKRKASPDAKTMPAKKRPPGRLKTDPDDDKNLQHDSTCCICMTEPDPADLAAINICDHMFCFDCIEKWADRENTCPLCKKRFIKIERVNKTKKKSAKSSKKVKNRSQRSEMTQTLALEGLFGELNRSGLTIESLFCK